MSLPQTGSSRRDAAIELAIVLVVSLALRFVLAAEAANRVLPALPVIDKAWLLFAVTVALLLWLARRHGGDFAQFGVRPFAPKGRLILIGVAGAVVDLVVNMSTSPFVEALFGKPDTHRFASITGNLPVYLMLVVAAIVFGGFGEEVLYRGIILTRLRALFGEGRGALAAAVVVQAVIFGAVHGYQGTAGMINIAIAGFVYGAIFVFSRGNIWPVAITHALIDILGFTLVFLGLMKV